MCLIDGLLLMPGAYRSVHNCWPSQAVTIITVPGVQAFRGQVN